MGRGAQYFELTMKKICRMAICERREHEVGKGNLNREVIVDSLEIEEAQASRFIREMISRNLIECVFRPQKREDIGELSKYTLTRKWNKIAWILSRNGILPGTCQMPGCTKKVEPVRFRGKFFCVEHLMNIGCSFCERYGTKSCAKCAERKGGMV